MVVWILIEDSFDTFHLLCLKVCHVEGKAGLRLVLWDRVDVEVWDSTLSFQLDLLVESFCYRVVILVQINYSYEGAMVLDLEKEAQDNTEESLIFSWLVTEMLLSLVLHEKASSHFATVFKLYVQKIFLPQVFGEAVWCYPFSLS